MVRHFRIPIDKILYSLRTWPPIIAPLRSPRNGCKMNLTTTEIKGPLTWKTKRAQWSRLARNIKMSLQF